MIIMRYMNRREFFGSRATANMFRRMAAWAVNDEGDEVYINTFKPAI